MTPPIRMWLLTAALLCGAVGDALAGAPRPVPLWPSAPEQVAALTRWAYRLDRASVDFLALDGALRGGHLPWDVGMARRWGPTPRASGSWRG